MVSILSHHFNATYLTRVTHTVLNNFSLYRYTSIALINGEKSLKAFGNYIQIKYNTLKWLIHLLKGKQISSFTFQLRKHALVSLLKPREPNLVIEA